MKLLLTLVFVIVSSACNKTEEITLSGDELVAVQARALSECLADTTRQFAEFKEDSSFAFGESTL